MPRTLFDSQQHQGWLGLRGKPVLCWNQWDSFAKCPTVWFVKHERPWEVIWYIYIFCWHVSLHNHLTFLPQGHCFIIMNVLEVWVNAGQQRRAFTAFSVCKVRKVQKDWEEKRNPFGLAGNHSVIPSLPSLASYGVPSTAQTSEVCWWPFLAATEHASAVRGEVLWQIRQVLNLLANLCSQYLFSPSIHSPASNGHKKNPKELKASTTAHT